MEEKELDLHEKYAEKSEEMQSKYHDAIYDIATKQGVDVGVGFDMLKAIARAEIDPKLKLDENFIDYSLGMDVELNREELVADYAELAAISMEILNAGN